MWNGKIRATTKEKEKVMYIFVLEVQQCQFSCELAADEKRKRRI